MKSARMFLIHALMAFSFAAVFYYNAVSPVGSQGSLIAPRSKFILALRRWVPQSGLNVLTRITGTCTTWRMYSPSWKYFLWFEWYAWSPQKGWVYLETPNLSPDYWRHRGLLEKWFQDCKVAALQGHLASIAWYQDTMVRYECRQATELNGWKPQVLRLVRKDRWIPSPERHGEWSPFGPADRTYSHDFACQ